ncbi:MAG: hypothetical protein Q4B26_12385 [Eubacteriales bacterium]|nr:hypothetical protein [Eubacteriales bacterium]
MILYATKQTIERYKLKLPEEFENPVMKSLVQAVMEKECGDSLLEWGVKLFYFDRRKCIQVCNFASRFTIVLVDVKVTVLESVGDAIAQYMMDIYSEEVEVLKLLERFFKESSLVCFSKLQDRRVIASLNHMQTGYLEDGYRMYDYIENGVLQTRKLNKFINTDYLVADKINGKKEYFFPAERFAELLKARYKISGN